MMFGAVAPSARTFGRGKPGAPSGGDPPPGDLTVVFETDWSTALGSTDNALEDGGTWDDASGGCLGVYDQVLSVVDGTSHGFPANCLQVAHRDTRCGNPNKVPLDGAGPGDSLRVRFLIQNNMTNVDGAPDGTTHGICHGLHDIQVIPWRNNVQVSAGHYDLQCGWGEEEDSNRSWSLTTVDLPNGTLFRYEYVIEIVSRAGGSCEIKFWPFVYNMAGALLYDADDFQRRGWGGDANETLRQWQDGGATRTCDESFLYDFAVGIEGNSNWDDTGETYRIGEVVIATGSVADLLSTPIGPA